MPSAFQLLFYYHIFLVDFAHHSLSIEGYHVSLELIERVRSGNWNPDNNEDDLNHRNALAARGYWQAFQSVEESIKKVLCGKNAGLTTRSDHGTWYRELFAPNLQFRRNRGHF